MITNKIIPIDEVPLNKEDGFYKLIVMFYCGDHDDYQYREYSYTKSSIKKMMEMFISMRGVRPEEFEESIPLFNKVKDTFPWDKYVDEYYSFHSFKLYHIDDNDNEEHIIRFNNGFRVD